VGYFAPTATADATSGWRARENSGNTPSLPLRLGALFPGMIEGPQAYACLLETSSGDCFLDQEGRRDGMVTVDLDGGRD
jgi:hypothetical protein